MGKISKAKRAAKRQRTVDAPTDKTIADAKAATTTAVEASAATQDRNAKRKREAQNAASLLPPPARSKAALSDRVKKYWFRRHTLFSRFDEGIRMDEQGWFSVTPEPIAQYLAERCRCDTILDLFAGVGGNAIQFAETCEQVVVVELDPVRMACTQHNAEVYGVADRIEYVLGDAIAYMERTRAVPDVVFLSPPWGGPEYLALDEYMFDQIPLDWPRLLAACLAKTRNLAMYMPKNLSAACIQEMAAIAGPLAVEEIVTHGSVRAVMLYTGELARVVAATAGALDPADEVNGDVVV
ncbi:RNA cap guanine-N2 methyltransferase-domain-containing protein [Blastocladiella britannica]|nr:RNA cap guanine-N2 methyltransferase-domain-containing protein [Blastocladiella britannica]